METTVQLEEYTRIAITGEASKIIALKWWLRRLRVKAYSLESQEEDDRQLIGIFRARDAQIITDWIKENAAPAMAEVLAPPPMAARYKKPATWTEALGVPAIHITCKGEGLTRYAVVAVPYGRKMQALCDPLFLAKGTEPATISALLIDAEDFAIVPFGARTWKIFANGKEVIATLGEPRTLLSFMSELDDRIDAQPNLTKLTERK